MNCRPYYARFDSKRHDDCCTRLPQHGGNVITPCPVTILNHLVILLLEIPSSHVSPIVSLEFLDKEHLATKWRHDESCTRLPHHGGNTNTPGPVTILKQRVISLLENPVATFPPWLLSNSRTKSTSQEGTNSNCIKTICCTAPFAKDRTFNPGMCDWSAWKVIMRRWSSGHLGFLAVPEE
jgi:hypothetical protein